MKTVCLILALAAAGPVFAQPFQKGTNVVSATAGFGSALGNFTYGSQTPAISLQFEKGVWETGGPGVISLGAYGGTKSYKYSDKIGSYQYSQKWSYTVIGVRSAYHYHGIDSDKFDVYAGLMLSYNILKYKYEDNGGGGVYNSGNYGSAAGITAYLGGRYFFSPNIGAVAELGYGVSYLSAGLALKF